MTTKEEALIVLNNLDPEVYIEVLKQRWEDDFFNKRSSEMVHYHPQLEYLAELENFYRKTRNKLEELRSGSRDRNDYTSYSELVVLLRNLSDIESDAVVEAQDRLNRRMNNG